MAEVAHGATVEVLQRLGPADVAVIDLPQQLLGVLVDAVEVGGDLQQHPLVRRNHDVDGGPPQVHLQRLRARRVRARRGAGVAAVGVGEQLVLAQVVLLEPIEDGPQLALERCHGPGRVCAQSLAEIAQRRQQLAVLVGQLLRVAAVVGRTPDLVDRTPGLLLAIEVRFQQRDQPVQQAADHAQVPRLSDLNEHAP